MASLKIIGSTETVDLPELGLSKVPAKIDTGAKTSVLHCKDFRVEKEGAKRYIYFKLQDDDKEHRFIVHREKKVKSSFGESEIRYIFITKILMFGREYAIKLSLRDRSSMKYPMLLGYNFLKGKFLVDVSKDNLSVNNA